VTEAGPGATLHKPGDRVAIAWLGYACGHCDHCVAGRETLCLSQQNSGYSVDGSCAEYAVADDHYVVTVPDGVSSFDAAPLTCAGVTTFKAIKVAGLQPGETASIIGIGGLGHLALQYAHVLGARVIIGSIVGTRIDLADVFALHAAGRTRVIAEPRQLQDVNTCFDEVLSGHIPARLVFTF
jgi:propanol-preferring alcohol dehydrogenase